MVPTGSGDVRKRQLDLVDVHGPSHGQEGAGAGKGSRGSGGWLREGGVWDFINV